MPLKLVRARKNGDGPWYIRGTVRGRRIEESTGTRERKRAEEFRARREAELLDEAIHGRAAVATFAHAAAAYLEFGGEGRFLMPILGHFRTTSLSKIDQSAVEACAKALYPGAKPSTIARQVYTPISAVLQYGASRGMCEAKTLKRPRPPCRVQVRRGEGGVGAVARQPPHDRRRRSRRSAPAQFLRRRRGHGGIGDTRHPLQPRNPGDAP